VLRFLESLRAGVPFRAHDVLYLKCLAPQGALHTHVQSVAMVTNSPIYTLSRLSSTTKAFHTDYIKGYDENRHIDSGVHPGVTGTMQSHQRVFFSHLHLPPSQTQRLFCSAEPQMSPLNSRNLFSD
jgi:hypothetical protein